MTREEIREAAKVMEAYASGKKIQYLDGYNKWIDATNPSFNWSDYIFRIKPEQKYRPFKTQEECWNEMLKHESFGWVEIRVTKLYTQIIAIDKTDVVIPNSIVKFDMAFEDFKFKDGTPFGIKEE